MEKKNIREEDYGVLARILRKVDFFAPLTVGQLEMVLPYILRYGYKAGETVFRQGDVGDAFYIVSTGKVDVRIKQGFFSFAKTVSVLGPGDFFGEMALLSRAPRSASVACLEPAELFVLLAADFQFILQQNPSFAAEVGKVAARRKFQSSHGAT